MFPCESTVATLKEIGITGEWVLSGREAVECCYARHELKSDYFAVILDWKMPEMDGIETARQIRKRERNSGFAIKASTPAAFASSSISLNS